MYISVAAESEACIHTGGQLRGFSANLGDDGLTLDFLMELMKVLDTKNVEDHAADSRCKGKERNL